MEFMNRHPFPDVVHAVYSKAWFLLWNTGSSFSLREEGCITQERVDEIETIAARHGIYLHRF